LRGIARAREEGAVLPGDIDAEEFDIGVAEDLITTTVDVRDLVDVKRRAMAAHGSQISETSFFLSMPLEHLVEAFGWEWYILDGAPPGTCETDVFEGLP
ncbi:MAG TPA: hypothetical protein VG455_08700, partial [Acidimicrobiales bacterium]|nr:hypothetical protein [Acidimicrobiales bacterium]